jgi:hypothetical protein
MLDLPNSRPSAFEKFKPSPDHPRNPVCAPFARGMDLKKIPNRITEKTNGSPQHSTKILVVIWCGWRERERERDSACRVALQVQSTFRILGNYFCTSLHQVTKALSLSVPFQAQRPRMHACLIKHVINNNSELMMVKLTVNTYWSAMI